MTEVLDSDGQPLKQFTSQCEQVMPGATADAVNDILRGVMEGGFGSALQIDKPSAGKTGTTNDGRSVWFVGYTPNLAAAAMIAGANGEGQWLELEGQVIGGQPIYSASGSGFAGPSGATRWPRSPPRSPTRTSRPARRRDRRRADQRARRVGPERRAATATLEGSGFVVANGGEVSSETGQGLVAYTSPEPGTSLSSGDTVTLYTSTGSVPPANNGGGKGRGKGRGGRG